MGILLRGILVISVLLSVVAVTPTESQSGGMSDEQGAAILNELKQIRMLLEKQLPSSAPPGVQPTAVPERVKLTSEQGYALGREDAPITLIEFTDYECSFCRQFHITTFQELKKQYIDKGLVRFISRDLPLGFHQYAMKAAEAARCAGEQGKFWEVRDNLIADANNLKPDAILSYIRSLNLDSGSFESCLNSDKYRPEITKDTLQAEAVAITGTPTFVLGRTSGNAVEGIKIIGTQPSSLFESRIKELLALDQH